MGKFEVFQDKSGKWRFHLKAANNTIVVTSQAYVEKRSALKGIASIRKNAAAAVVEV